MVMGSSQNLYKYLKFDAALDTIRFVGLDATIDNGLTITSGGQTITAGGQTITAGGQTITAGGQTIVAGGQTITAGGQTITAGGQTVTSGDVKLVNGTIYAGQKIFVGATTSSGPCLMTGTVAPSTYFGLGSIYIDTVTASLYVQTATNAWKQFATPF